MHFSRIELIRSKIAQARGIDNTPPDSILPALDFTIAGLERVRYALGQPMIISSGYRCFELNQAVGGSPRSQHMAGQAADFTAPAFGDPQKIVAVLTPMRFLLGIDQLILESGWVHASFALAPRYQVLSAIGGGRTQTLV